MGHEVTVRLGPPESWDKPCDTMKFSTDTDWGKKNHHVNKDGIKHANGDCFIKNYKEFKRLEALGYTHLHYAIIIMRYKASGNIITHALVYDGDIQHDVSQGNNRVITRDQAESILGGRGYSILKYSLFNSDNLPSLENILSGWLKGDSWGQQYMTMGNLPKLKGRWEAAALRVI
jgi:hypothetical protein